MEILRESIFISSLRSFCRMFFAVSGIFIALVLLTTLYSAVTSPGAIEPKTTVTYLPDAKGTRELAPHSAPVVLEIKFHGVIGDPKVLDTDTVQNILLDSRSGVLANNRVKAILLHMNTPGGTVVDSDNIYRMLKTYKERYKVPVYAYVDGLCASGGVYISSAADKVFAGPASIIGSVGVVIGPFFNVYDTLQKIGIHALTVTAGLDKDMLNPTRPWKPGEDASLKAVTAYFYDRFVDVVTEARPNLDKNMLVSKYGAKVFDPVEAQNLGYVDMANASRDETLLALLKEAQIDESKPYQVVELQPKSDLLSMLLAKSPLVTGKVEHSLDTGMPKIREQFAYLYQPSSEGWK
jgi:signal peptide peptidase SppA